MSNEDGPENYWRGFGWFVFAVVVLATVAWNAAGK